MNQTVGKTKRVLAVVLTAVSIVRADASDAMQHEGVSETFEDGKMQLPLEMVLDMRHVVTDEAGRQKREEALKLVTTVMKELDTERKFDRYKDGTPFFGEALTECEGAYPDIPCFVVVDDEAVHGCAIYPEADVRSTNMAEFVTIANQRILKGRFVHDTKTGFVMYQNSVPMSEFRNQPIKLIGQVFGFPVMQASLYSESYRAVLKGKAPPLQALEQVREKLRELVNRQAEQNDTRTNAVQAIVSRYFEKMGYAATGRDGPSSIFGGEIVRERAEGGACDAYSFRLITSDSEAMSYVCSPVKMNDHAAEVRLFVSLLNRETGDSGFAFSFIEPSENDGYVSCRKCLSVDELKRNVEDGMNTLLDKQVDVLAKLAETFEKLANGKLDARTAMVAVKKLKLWNR